jgi:hypothetical protein
MTHIGKKKYSSMKAAIRVAERMRRKKSDGKNIQAYNCPICRFYHVGNVQGVRA